MRYIGFMKTYTQLKKQLLEDKEVKRTYEALGPEFKIVSIFIKKRLERGLTQKDLARYIGTKQSAVSRFESGEYNPTLNFLQKMAEGLNTQIKVTLNKRG